MLSFERRFVGGPVSSPDRRVPDGVEGIVEGTRRDMPQLLRAGVLAESLAPAGRLHRPAIVGVAQFSPRDRPYP